jgi:hypothetical protein
MNQKNKQAASRAEHPLRALYFSLIFAAFLLICVPGTTFAQTVQPGGAGTTITAPAGSNGDVYWCTTYTNQSPGGTFTLTSQFNFVLDANNVPVGGNGYFTQDLTINTVIFGSFTFRLSNIDASNSDLQGERDYWNTLETGDQLINLWDLGKNLGSSAAYDYVNAYGYY